MISKRIEDANVELARDQPEFARLWARATDHGDGLMEWRTAWEPTPDELELLNKGAAVELSILAYGHPPVMLFVGKAPSDEL